MKTPPIAAAALSLCFATAAYGAVESTTRVTLNLLRGSTTVEVVSGPDYATARALCEERARARASAETRTSGTLTFTCQTEKLIVTVTYSAAKLLFRTDFENVVIQPPTECWGTGCWQNAGNWLWGGRFLLLSDPVQTTAASIVNRMFNRIEATDRGKSLFQQISVNVNGTGPMGSSSEQNEFQFLPKTDPGDVYLSFWMKLQPDLVQKMRTDFWGNDGTWRAIFAFKTGGQTAWGGPANDGDYRVEAYVQTRNSGGTPYWAILGDNNAGGGAPLVNNWYIENRSIPVPLDRWFKVEVFWHRSNTDGRIWFAADGQVIADRRGPNMGAWNLPINRIIAPMLYTGGAMPVYQWVDDVEVWDGFPPIGSNPPYAAH